MGDEVHTHGVIESITIIDGGDSLVYTKNGLSDTLWLNPFEMKPCSTDYTNHWEGAKGLSNTDSMKKIPGIPYY